MNAHTVLSRLLAQGHSLADMEGLVRAFQSLPPSFRTVLTLRAGDMVLPLDVAVECLRRELVGWVRPTPPPTTSTTSLSVTVPREGRVVTVRPEHGAFHVPAEQTTPAVVPSEPMVHVTLPAEEMAPVVVPSEPIVHVTLPVEETAPGVVPSQSSVGKLPVVGTEVTRNTGRTVSTKRSPPSLAAGPMSSVTGPSDVSKKPRAHEESRSKDCAICGAHMSSLKYHMECAHLPWFYFPSYLCFVCQVKRGSHSALLSHVTENHGGDLKVVGFQGANYQLWLSGMLGILDTIARALGFVAPAQLLELCTRRHFQAMAGTQLQGP
jgi:hypothetical protein